MGYVCGVHCNQCGYDKTFRLGCGRKDFDIKQIYSHFGLEDVWMLKVMVLEHNSDNLTFRYRLGKCNDCGQLLEVPEVIFGDGTAFHGRRCACDPEKEHEMTLYEGETDMTIPCPQCGSRIQTEMKGLWD